MILASWPSAIDSSLLWGFLAGTGATLLVGRAAWAFRERRRWKGPAGRLAEQVMATALDPREGAELAAPPQFRDLGRAIEALAARARRAGDQGASRLGLLDSGTSSILGPMTRSGLYEAPSGVFSTASKGGSGSSDFTTPDMVNRLEPEHFRWIASSPTEQAFLGWTLAELWEKSFLDVVHEDDVGRARSRFAEALVKGEAHGLILRVRTAKGKIRAVSIDVAARYAADQRVNHLRCHVTDVTSKLRAERELRQRTRELVDLNARLREANLELEELKELYRDLYQNAPAMYFSLDASGRIIECNDTLLKSLGLARADLIGRSYASLLPPDLRPQFADRFREFLKVGSIEVESRWARADGLQIDVWVKGLAVRGPDGRVVRSRSVAQDVTARKRLESELREKNERLANANDELTRRNKEMDEFLYVVSHDLQEPLRTLVAFSDFLVKDYGDRIDGEGRDFLNYIVDASRRMRALIQDLSTLSRAGRVTAEFGRVKLDKVFDVVRADLAERVRSQGGELRLTGELPDVWGDRDRLGQLMTNLVNNGLKYNVQPRPLVEVRAERGEDGRVTVAVSDNGIGIDPKFHAKIFQLFRRLHTRDEYEGTGAGLAICQKIVEAHGGQIWVESEPNRGSTFFVTLPGPPAETAGQPRRRPTSEPGGGHDDP